MTYSYFPGCSLHGMASEYDCSARRACELLNVKLQDIPNWTCCGATPGHATNHLLGIALPVLTLAGVWRDSRLPPETPAEPPPTLMTACAACYSRFRTANYEVRRDPSLRTRVGQVLEQDYEGGVEVRHLLEVLGRDVGLQAISERTVRPLAGLRVACYYGCLLVRPPAIVAFDDPENPRMMDEVLTAAGAECVDWPFRAECCGGNLSVTRPKAVVRLVKGLLDGAREAGADAVAVACPLCQSNLDLRQADASMASGIRYNLPIFYFTQLLGLAFGLEPKALGLNRLMTSPKAALSKLAVVPQKGV